MNNHINHILYEYGLLGSEHAVLATDTQRDFIITNNDHNDEPVALFVTELMKHAVQQHVSDIHLEPAKNHYQIRFRCDGILNEYAQLPAHFAARIVTHLKVMSQLDIAEKRLPQDGRLALKDDKPVDIRISTCPAMHGEKIVLRILRHEALQHTLDQLGMSHDQLVFFQHALQQPQGLILVTGPTGSGKTSTLYAALQTLNQPEKNIMAVEDPIEIELPGITQVNINPRIGLSFAKTLRTFLRQDPDIIMIGEIRDAETAAIALQAAQTGHLVLSTLHTNHAADTLKRLQNMNIPPSYLSDSLLLLVAQRLVRQCYKGGYQGRTGIFEVLPISSETTNLMMADANLHDITLQFQRENHLSMLAHGREKITAGITNRQELKRVLGAA